MFRFIPVTHSTADTKHPLVILLAEHGDRYFFGKVAEGAQRACVESKTKLSKLNTIFLTGELDWSSIGGLPGMILTISDQGKKDLELVYGSHLLSYAVSTWRYFVFRFGMNLSVTSLDNNVVFKDENITVKAINIGKPDTKKTLPFSDAMLSDLRSLVSKMFPLDSQNTNGDPPTGSSLDINLPVELISQISTSYEITFNPVRGRFNLDSAIKLGIPKGPMFSILAGGKPVTLPDGTVISPDQVLSEQRKFPKVLILDIPNDSYLKPFFERFKDYDTKTLGSVYYFLGNNITLNSTLIKFMEIFNDDHVHHFVSHEKVSPNSISFWSSTVTMLKLKALQQGNYNIPSTDGELSKGFYDCFNLPLPNHRQVQESSNTALNSKLDNKRVHVYKKEDTLTIEPYTPSKESIKQRVESTADVYASWEQAFKKRIKPLNIAGVNLKSLITDQINVDNFNTEGKRNQVEIVTLGTGSALPSKYRNVISTVIKVPYRANGRFHNRIIILDAGENTLGSIHRLINKAKIPEFFHNLKMIYLSHLHADHHLGIVSLINEWYAFNKGIPNSKLYLVSPWKYETFITEWFTLENKEILERIRYIGCQNFLNSSMNRDDNASTNSTSNSPSETKNQVCANDEQAMVSSGNFEKRRRLDDFTPQESESAIIQQMKQELCIMSFRTCKAIHCEWSYSNSITFYMQSDSRKLFKVSYSGDTRPNVYKFANGIGKNSDLLIHEATLDNELVADAKKKRHSTINEAILVSNAMNAKKVLLTHFSQRYPKAPQMSGSMKVAAEAICYAFDGMIVSYDKLGEQYSNVRMLKHIFSEEEKLESEG
ncbi:tRNase Z Ecym_4049 [Eremothecium cymbalariae DBVPG|uniref:ribonuclease Z n=1 Tax=Eremothecium cymbalariae (strain CBS 270.75 / DBVPG 7215 / KCTC 17166 / NRRL Y-17582) TaxID=931890 RepID=G8JSX7_ERECY|nr:hypothetical protein Ecym_4049 [Eremothecium cymbalariae DBVPG\